MNANREAKDRTDSYSYPREAKSDDRRLSLRNLSVAPSFQKSIAAPKNRLLAALKPQEFQLLARSLEAVRFSKDRIIYEAADNFRRAFFINSGLASLLAITEKGQTIEAGIIGREGFVGVPIILGLDRAYYRVIARTRVEAMKVDSLALREQFNSSDTLHRVLLQYANVLQTQAVQATVCRVLHNLNQRLARWLLVTSDCLEADVFKVTHEQIATALGKHRNRVGVAASRLQREGLIECERGRIKIVEREGLKAVACECYRIVQACMDSVG